MSAVQELPARCECGWILPAAFQVMAPEAPEVPYPKGAMLLFACGNCGAWHSCNLSSLGGARSPNAAGFGGMDLARLDLTSPPAFFPCGCSRLKVEAGKCDLFRTDGRPRDSKVPS